MKTLLLALALSVITASEKQEPISFTAAADSKLTFTYERTEHIQIFDLDDTSILLMMPKGEDGTYWKGVDRYNLCITLVDGDENYPTYQMEECHE